MRLFMAKYQQYVIACAAFGLLSLFVYLLHFNGLYGQDGYEYLRYCNALHGYFQKGINPGDMFFPMFYSMAGSLICFVFPSPMLVMQGISIVAFCIGMVYIQKAIQLMFNEDNKMLVSIYIVVFFILSPYVFRFSVLVMSDMLAMMFCLATLFHAVSYFKSRANKDFVFCIMFSLAAILTRTPCAIVVSIPVFLVCIRFIKQFDLVTFLIALATAAILLAPDYLLRHRVLFFELVHQRPRLVYLRNYPSWSVLNLFMHEFMTNDGHLTFRQWNIFQVFFNFIHPGYLFAGIVFVMFIRKVDFSSLWFKIISVVVLVYAIFLAGFNSQNMRYLLIDFPWILILFYPAFKRIAAFLVQKKIAFVCLLLTVAVQLIFTGYSFATVYRYNKADREFVGAIKSYPGRTVYCFGPDGALKAYGLPNKIINISDYKLDHVEPNSLILVNPVSLGSQFSGTNPGINWKFIQKQKTFRPLEKLADGWELYETNDDKAW